MILPPEIHDWLARLHAEDILLPPLAPPECCERCQRPLEPDKQRFRTCFECGRTHGPELARVSAATYAAVGTAPWELFLDAKYERLSREAVSQRVTLVAAAIWATVEQVAPASFEEGAKIILPIPSSRDLLERCAATASARGWPALEFDDWLRAEDRPRQSELSASGRQEAARRKYAVDGDLSGKAVLILDDVYTSGFTMHDAARAAAEAGATSVVGVVYARRVFPDAMALYREARRV